MSQFLVTVNDNQAESLLGGSGYTQYPSYKKPTSTIKQSVFAPIKSVSVSSASATALNIGSFNIKSPQFATAIATSEANSTVLGGIVSA